MNTENPCHPIPAVARLVDHVNLLIRVLELEVDSDTPNPLPYQIQETYRTWLVRARGIPAVESLSAWAGDNVEAHVPEVIFDKFDQAVEHLQDLRWRDAAGLLMAAGRVLALEVPKGLNFQEMARIACLSSTITIIAELLGVYMTFDLQEPPHDTWAFVEDDADATLIVPIVGDIVSHQKLRLDGLNGPMLRDVLREATPSDVPGLLLLLWAVECGQVEPLRVAIETRVAEKRRSLEHWKQTVGIQPAAC